MSELHPYVTRRDGSKESVWVVILIVFLALWVTGSCYVLHCQNLARAAAANAMRNV